jgi:hypothetical protein
MAGRAPRKVQRERWQRNIVRHLEDFPRQYAALETAMAGFGEDFDLPQFKAAFTTRDDMEAYNRVQAVERAVGRVENFVSELAQDGSRLAGLRLPSMSDDGSAAQQAFEALRDAGVLDGRLCRRLITAHQGRSRIEHKYVDTPAGDVHRAAELVRETARDFIRAYRGWIETFLEPAS